LAYNNRQINLVGVIFKYEEYPILLTYRHGCDKILHMKTEIPVTLCKRCVHGQRATSRKDLHTFPKKDESIFFEPIVRRLCLTPQEQAADDFVSSIELGGGEVKTEIIRSEADWNTECVKPESFSPKKQKST